MIKKLYVGATNEQVHCAVCSKWSLDRHKLVRQYSYFDVSGANDHKKLYCNKTTTTGPICMGFLAKLPTLSEEC